MIKQRGQMLVEFALLLPFFCYFFLALCTVALCMETI